MTTPATNTIPRTRLRIALVGLGVVLLVLCCFSASLYGLIASGLGGDRDKQLGERADAALVALASADPASLRADSRPLARLAAPVDPRTDMDIFVLVLDERASVLMSGAEIDGAAPAIPAPVLASAAADGRPVTVTAGGVALRAQVRHWERADLAQRGYVVAAQAARRTQRDAGALLVLFVLAGLVAFVAAAAALWVVTGRALRPLGAMTALMDQARAAYAGIEAAYAGARAALAAQHRFTADASHELRTPLTTVRNNAEFLLQHPDARDEDREAALRDIAGESARMGRLVEQLLTLARADAGASLLRSEPVDLSDAAAAVCRQAAALHPTRRIEAVGTPARPVEGDADALRQLLWILVDNAVKFTRDGGRVWVTVTQRGERVQVHVADDGVGLPPDALERIFDRFYRADPARSGAGAGLGLAIADWIVRQHGGQILAANNDRGGATFTVDLPGTDVTVALGPAPFSADHSGGS